MSQLYYLAISLTIISNIIYHLAMKGTNSQVNPFFSLTASYLTSALLSSLIFVFGYRDLKFSTEMSKMNVFSILLGIAIVFLELGFILAYRAGWNISLAALTSNVAVGALLLPIGLIFFRENLSTLNFIGIGFALVGLVLMGIKSTTV